MFPTRLIASALAAWLSGVACLVACAAMCGRATGGEAAAERPCCHRSAEIEAEESGSAALSTDELRGEPSLDSCCFLRARASIPGLVSKSAGVPLAPDVDCDVLVSVGVVRPQAGVVASFPPLNRGDTHIRCCVFLI